MEATSPRRSIVGSGLIAAALSLVVLWPGGAGAVHTPDVPAFAPIIDYKLCNDLSPWFDGPPELQGDGGMCDDAGYAVAPPVVDIGCPSPSLAVLGGPWWINGRPNDEGTPVPLVTEASFYRLFVFVMPSLEEIDRVLAGTTHRRAAQEFISANIDREGPTRVQVTSAVYVTPEEIQAGGRFLSDVMAQGLGIGGR